MNSKAYLLLASLSLLFSMMLKFIKYYNELIIVYLDSRTVSEVVDATNKVCCARRVLFQYCLQADAWECPLAYN